MIAVSNLSDTAWGDESIRISAPTPTYLMAATILQEGTDTSHLEVFKPKGASKLHWRELTDKLRRKSLEEIASLDGFTVMIACSPLPKKKQERGRRRCMELLLPELEARGVELLTLESRVLQMDRKDIDMLQALKSKGVVPDMRLRHAHASDEPRLWVVDQILGAYGDWLCNDDAPHKWGNAWEEILSRLTVLETRF